MVVNSEVRKAIEQQKMLALRRSGMRFAEDWNELGNPVPFDQTYVMNGIRIRIQAEKFMSIEDTQPISRVERDEEDRQAD